MPNHVPLIEHVEISKSKPFPSISPKSLKKTTDLEFLGFPTVFSFTNYNQRVSFFTNLKCPVLFSKFLKRILAISFFMQRISVAI